ncbi:MAG: hypothetical protein ACPGVG_02030 [Mycobacterium sp.]
MLNALNNNGVLDGRGRDLFKLVQAARGLGLEVPGEIDAEAELYTNRTELKKAAQTAYTEAAGDLYTVEPEGFEDAQSRAVDAFADLLTAQRGELDEVFTNVCVERLGQHVGRAAARWEVEIAEKFNAVVADYKLNEVARHLPDVTNPGSFKVLGLSERQLNAITQWRQASDHLRPLWDAYKRIAGVRGVELGPRSVEDYAINKFTAICLGIPENNRQAGSAADYFSGLAVSGSIAAGEYEQITPFVVPVICGYELHLNTYNEALDIQGELTNKLCQSMS